MSTTVNQYRVYCTTDSKYITTWDTDKPISCPENNTHTIGDFDITRLYDEDKEA